MYTYSFSFKKYFSFSLLLAYSTTYAMHLGKLDLDILGRPFGSDPRSEIFTHIINDRDGGTLASKIYEDLCEKKGGNYAMRTVLLYLKEVENKKMFSIAPDEQLELMHGQPDIYNLLKRLDPAFKIQSDEQQTKNPCECLPMDYNIYVTENELITLQKLPENVYNKIKGYSVRLQKPSSKVIQTHIIQSHITALATITYACMLPFSLGLKLIDEVQAKVSKSKRCFGDITWGQIFAIPYLFPRDHLMNCTHENAQPITSLAYAARPEAEL